MAGGFGAPTRPHPTFFPPEPLFPRETVPVRANYQVYQNGATGLRSRGRAYSYSLPDQTEISGQEPIVSESTPFFHVDLVAAVRAAEKLGLKAEERENEIRGNGANGGLRSDILIDLHG